MSDLPTKDQLEQLVDQMHRSGILLSEAQRAFKKTFIECALKAHKGNQCKAAKAMGCHRNTLSRDIAELKIDVKEYLPKPSPRAASLQRWREKRALGQGEPEGIRSQA